MIDEFKSAITFFMKASLYDRLIVILFALVLSVALLFEWLWLRERNHRFLLENRDSIPKATPTAIATLMRSISVAMLELLGKLTLKSPRILSRIISSSQKARSPTKTNVAQVDKSDLRFTVPDANTGDSDSQSQENRG